MKRFFLYGDWQANAGPMNVNRSWIEHSDGSMDYTKCENRCVRKLEKIWKCLRYKTIVFSGGISLLELRMSKCLGKRIVYVMHGCSQYENVINKLGLTDKQLQSELVMLDMADTIIAVSEKYAEWVKGQFPQYAAKVKSVNNGLEISKTFYEHAAHADGHYTIAVSGGNRPIKRNLAVCQAVERLNDEGWDIKVCAFGLFHENGEKIFGYPFVERMGQMDKATYYKKLKSVDLMVVNSEIEPFGLVVGDALNCGCSLLMSKNVGAASIFRNLQNVDVIEDNHDVEEIATKMEGLLKYGNAERLFNSVDSDKCSGRQAFLNLKKICIDE